MTDSVSASPHPDGLGEDNIRPVESWRRHASPLGLILTGGVVVLALTGLLGRERTWIAEAEAARLEVHAPEIIRNGEFFEMRIGVTSREPIEELVIGMDESLWTDITVNTLIPAASEEESADGEVRFAFAEMPGGSSFLFKLDLQVNPDIILGNEGRIAVYDGEVELAATDVSITVLP